MHGSAECVVDQHRYPDSLGCYTPGVKKIVPCNVNNVCLLSNVLQRFWLYYWLVCCDRSRVLSYEYLCLPSDHHCLCTPLCHSLAVQLSGKAHKDTDYTGTIMTLMSPWWWSCEHYNNFLFSFWLPLFAQLKQHDRHVTCINWNEPTASCVEILYNSIWLKFKHVSASRVYLVIHKVQVIPYTRSVVPTCKRTIKMYHDIGIARKQGTRGDSIKQFSILLLYISSFICTYLRLRLIS